MVRVTVMFMLLVALALPLVAQVPTPAAAQADIVDCAQIYQQALVDMMAHCFGSQPGTICGASGDVTITTQSGQTATGPGASARLSGVKSLALGHDNNAWPLASLMLPDAFDARKSAALIVMGDTDITFKSSSALGVGAAFTLETSNAPLCSDLPYPGLLVQSPQGSLTQLRINETDVLVNGMALIRARNGGTLEVNALTKETILGQSGAVVFAGYSVNVTGEYAGEIAPYDAARVDHLPVQILPEMQPVALPGNATVTEAMNLFFQPGPEYYSSTMVNKGLPVNLFGRDSSGDWAYVRTYEGYLGWIPAYVLDLNVPGELPVLDEAPAGLIRPFGSVQGYIKTSWEYNNLREGPGEQFAIIETVPLWTDLALYGRSPDGNWLYVETLDEVRAWVSTDIVSNSTPYTLEELPVPPEVMQ